MDPTSSAIEIDIHQLELRYAHTRLISPDSLRSLCASLEQFGQISPLVSVNCGSLVLIDGYRRVAALKRNGRDRAVAEVWTCSEQEALVRLLAKSRRWDALEEASLLRELLKDSELSRARLAGLLGRNPSWVTRRLDLLDGLNEQLLGLISSGHLSSWAASRVIVPLARANEAHAVRLAGCIAKEGLSTRDLVSWFNHYQRSNHSTREKMAADPFLFLKAARAKAQEVEATHLRQGPQGRWGSDLGKVLTTLRRLAKETAVLYGADLGPSRQTLHHIKAVLSTLDGQIERMLPHDNLGDQASDPCPSSQTNSHPHHQ